MGRRVGLSPAHQDVIWAIRGQAEHVGFVQTSTLCWSEFFANSRGEFWLLQHKERGVRWFEWLLETPGDQNSPQKARSQACSWDLRSRNCYQNNWLSSSWSFHHSTLRHWYQRERVLFAEPQFSAHLFPRETRSLTDDSFRLLPLVG